MLLLAIRRSMASSAADQASRWWPRYATGVSSPAMRKARRSSRVEHVPDPGDGGLALDHLGGEIAAHAIGRRAFARHHRQPARLRLVVEVLHQLGGIDRAAGRRSIRRRRWRRAAGRPRRPGGCRYRTRRAPARRGPRQANLAVTKRRAARKPRPPELDCIDTPVAGFSSLSPSIAADRSGSMAAGVQPSGVWPRQAVNR